jgi:hypothetical protein
MAYEVFLRHMAYEAYGIRGLRHTRSATRSATRSIHRKEEDTSKEHTRTRLLALAHKDEAPSVYVASFKARSVYVAS